MKHDEETSRYGENSTKTVAHLKEKLSKKKKSKNNDEVSEVAKKESNEEIETRKLKKKRSKETVKTGHGSKEKDKEEVGSDEEIEIEKKKKRIGRPVKFALGTKGEEDDSSSNGEIETPKEYKEKKKSKLGDDNGIVKSDKTDDSPSSSQHKKDKKKKKKLTKDCKTLPCFAEEPREQKKKKKKTDKFENHLQTVENGNASENEITVSNEEEAAGCSGIKKKKEKNKTIKLMKDGSEQDKTSDSSESVLLKSENNLKKKKKKSKQSSENQEMDGKSQIKKLKKNKDEVSEMEDKTTDQHSETEKETNRDEDKLETEQEESKKKKRKSRDKANMNMNNQEDEVQVKKNKIDEAVGNQEAGEKKKKKKKRKRNEHEEVDDEMCNTPRKIKGIDMEQKSEDCSTETPIATKPFQPTSKEIWKSPVCESEERQHKFQRLLGGNKSSNKKPSFQSRLSVSENTKEEGIDSHNGVGSEEKGSSPVPGAGQWKGMMFENAERQNKFLRLLGGAKSQGDKKKTLFSSNSSGPKKGLFGSLVSSSSGVSKALNLQSAASLNQRLEEDYNQALNKRIGGMGAAGIGFVKDPAEGKKFHIDSNSTKSVKFSDDDE